MKRIIAFVLALIMIMGLGVTAFAEEQWTVTFNLNGGVHNGKTGNFTRKVDKGTSVKKPGNDPTKSGYVFCGWYHSGKAWDFTTPITKDITLNAKWGYTVTFNMNGGTPQIPSQNVIENKKAKKPSITPEKTGYTFKGWFNSGDEYDFDTPITKNIKINAKWTAQKYNITYKDQGGNDFSGIHEEGYPTTHTYNANTTLKSASKTGYTFDGWFIASDCSGVAVTILGATDYTDNITLYAKWAINKYTVSFNAQGHGTAPEEQTIDYNKKATKPANPTDSDWSFVNWYTEATCDNEFNFETPITKDTNLFAKWLALHKVTFEVEKTGVEGIANAPSEKKIVDGGYVAEPEIDPTSTSHDFKGWYKEDACTNKWKFDSDTVTEDTTIYAKWEIKKFNVTFDMGDVDDAKDAPTAQKVDYKNKAEVPTPAPSKTGYVFRGWVNAEGAPFDFNTQITANTTIYAKWLRLIKKPTASLKTYTYTGSEQTYDVPGTADYDVSGNKQINVKSDYEVIYSLKDKNSTAWDNGVDAYSTDDVKLTWAIAKADIVPKFTDDVTRTFGDSESAILSAVKANVVAVKANVVDEIGVAIDPDDIVIKYKAENDTEFTADVPTAVGTYTLAVNVKNSDNYNGYFEDDVTCTLTINPKEIDIIWTNTEFVYNGIDQTAAIEAKFEDINGEDIFLDVDVTGGKFKNAGTYTVTAKLRNGYENYKLPSSAATSYTIAAKNISGATVELGDALIYNGKSQTQTVKKVTVDGLEATYTVSGNVQKEVGTYTLTVTGTGNFSGTATKQFVIIPDKNYHYKVNKYGDIEIGDGEISFKDDNEKHMPEISIAGNKGDLVEMLVKMGKITSDDLVRIANGKTLNVMLETQKTYVSDRVWDKIEKRAGNKEIDSYFDIEFYLYWNDDTENRTDITDTSGYGYITVEVEAPDVKHAKSRSYSVIRYHNDGYKGHAVELSAKYDSKRETLTFRTNQFSVYAIAYSDVRDDDDDGKIVINGKSDKKKDDKKKDINPNTGALVF